MSDVQGLGDGVAPLRGAILDAARRHAAVACLHAQGAAFERGVGLEDPVGGEQFAHEVGVFGVHADDAFIIGSGEHGDGAFDAGLERLFVNSERRKAGFA